jgi:hypothetical protein
MSIEVALIGDLLVVVEEDSVAPLAGFEKGDSRPSPVEESALYGAWIIRHRPFSENNQEIGYEVMCQMLEEAGHLWPRPEEDAPAIEAMLKAFEAGRISEARFVDWVRQRVATA